MTQLLSTSLARDLIQCLYWTSWAGMSRISIQTSSRTGVSSEPGTWTTLPQFKVHLCHALAESSMPHRRALGCGTQ